jgi:hypothetical protein
MLARSKLSVSAAIAANCATVVLCGVLAVSVIKTAFFGSQPQPSRPDQVKIGDRVAISGATLGPGDTVVLALREGCAYCVRSAPLYKEIVTAARARNRRVVAVLDEPVDRARSYLGSLGIDLSEVYQAKLSSLRVHGTPTLLLISGAGVVKRLWNGLQPADQNSSIVRQILGPA